MVKEENLLDYVNRIINHNGGWFVCGFTMKMFIGATFEYHEHKFVIIKESNQKEGEEDCLYLDLPFVRYWNYYYRCSTD